MKSWREIRVRKALSELCVATYPFVRLSHVLEHGYDGGDNVAITRDDLLRLVRQVNSAKLLLEGNESAQ